MTIEPRQIARAIAGRRLALATVIAVMVAPAALLASSVAAPRAQARASTPRRHAHADASRRRRAHATSPRHHAHPAEAPAADLGAFAEGVLARGGDGALANAQAHDPQLDAAAAELIADGPQGRVWLIPTDDGRICLGVEPDGHYDAELPGGGALGVAYTCRAASAADAAGIQLGIFHDAVGVVPDASSELAVSSPPGATAPLARSGDVWRYSYPADAAPGSASVSFTIGGVAVSSPVF